MDLKFSIQIENQLGYDWSQIKNIILDTEKHGYHSFYICDHFFLDADSENVNALEAWTVLTAASMITDKIKLGTLVSGNNYRNPAMLAKIAASLDMISNGRLEFGIGAGWKEIEYLAYGYEFPSVNDRMEMLEESVQIVKKLWTEGKATFEGKHFRIKDAFCYPKPVQENPLFIIGGGGEKRTLKIVAKYADYCNLFALPLDDLNRKLEALKRHAQKLGRNYSEIGKSLFTQMWVAETQDEVDAYFKTMSEGLNRDEAEMKKRLYPANMPGGWIGTPEQVRDRIEFMQSLGFDYFFFQQPLDVNTDMVVKFAELVKNKYFR